MLQDTGQAGVIEIDRDMMAAGIAAFEEWLGDGRGEAVNRYQSEYAVLTISRALLAAKADLRYETSDSPP